MRSRTSLSPDCTGMLKCSQTLGSSATASMMRSVMSLGYDVRKRNRSMPSMSLSVRSRSPRSGASGRSWPYASTVWPSTVTSRTARGEVLDFCVDVIDRATAFAAAPVGDDAVGAELVAAVDDRHVRRHGVGRGERRRPELAAEIVVADRLEDRLELLRPRECVDVGEATLEVVGLEADHAAHDGDLEVLPAPAQLLERAELAHRPLLGVIADRTGVEHDEVGFLRSGDFGPAEAVEAGGQLLRVGDVHLTADGPDVVAVHDLGRSLLKAEVRCSKFDRPRAFQLRTSNFERRDGWRRGWDSNP